MINPYNGVLEYPQISNPVKKTAMKSYTEFVDLEADFPDVEYLDLDNFSDDVQIIDDDCEKTKRTSRRVWQDTNKEEWWNIYQQYMRERVRRHASPTLTRHRQLSRGLNVKKTKQPLKREYPEYVCDSENEQNDGDDEEDLKTFILLEDPSDQDDGSRSLDADAPKSQQERTPSPASEYLDGEESQGVEYLSKDDDQDDEEAPLSLLDEGSCETSNRTLEGDQDEYGEVEYLSEEDFADESPPTPEPPNQSRGIGRPPDFKMQCAVEAVRDARLSRQQAARRYRVPLEALCSRLQRIAPVRDKQRNMALNKAKFHKMLDNTLILLANSNICIFKYRKKQYSCFFCNTAFDDMAPLRQHTKERHTMKKMKRKLLKQRFSYNRADISDLKCKICSHAVDSIEELESHLTKHDVKMSKYGSTLMPFKIAAKELTCQFCYSEFGTASILFKHMYRHYLHCICEVCCMAFSNAHSLKLHHHHMHSPVDCKVCGVTLKNVHVKKKHDAIVHGVKNSHIKAKFKCTFCPEEFMKDYIRIKHILEEHNGDRTLYKCDYCPKMFITIHWCTRHMNCVHRQEQEACNERRSRR